MKLLLAAAALLLIPVAVIAIVGRRLPVAHVAVRSAVFRHSQVEVWQVISGPPDWRPEVARVERLPDRNGHRAWREFGKDGRSVAYELVEEDAPRKMVTRIADTNLPYTGTWTYELAPDKQGSSLTVTEAGAVYSPFYRFVSRYITGETATMDAYLAALSRKLGESK